MCYLQEQVLDCLCIISAAVNSQVKDDIVDISAFNYYTSNLEVENTDLGHWKLKQEFHRCLCRWKVWCLDEETWPPECVGNELLT